jgi:L-ribulokinase
MSSRKGEHFVLGIDFGTDSVRVLVVDAADGSTAGNAVSAYTRWADSRFCDSRENRFRQHPLDYVESMGIAAREALFQAGGEARRRVRALTVDTTGSTPCFADGRGRPLSLQAEFAEDPDAMFILWKDHCAVEEAARINELAKGWGGEDFTKFEGGVYSSEWFWAKVMRVAARNPQVSAAARTVVEHCDWMPALLSGTEELGAFKRSRCAAGHKAMWHESWGGYPPPEFLAKLHPRLVAIAASLGERTYTADEVFGRLCPEWATRLGLGTEVIVGVGAFDAHLGAVGGEVGPGTLLRIMGTSTCDIMVGPRSSGGEKLVRGICGQVDGSVIPGLIGYEAGQSAFGDIFAWFRDILAWPLRSLAGGPSSGAAEDSEKAVSRILPALEAEATQLEPGASGLLALDWLNGRRTPDADQALTGALVGLRLGTDAPSIYRALIEAAAYGSRAIVDRLIDEGVAIERVAAVGGVARKSPLVMQVCADVLGMEISVSSSDQSCALGAAMLASVAAGLHADVGAAQNAMRAPVERVYRPDPTRTALYAGFYDKYKTLGAFVEKEFA